MAPPAGDILTNTRQGDRAFALPEGGKTAGSPLRRTPFRISFFHEDRMRLGKVVEKTGFLLPMLSPFGIFAY